MNTIADRMTKFIRMGFYLLFGLISSSLALRLMLSQEAPPFAPWLVGGLIGILSIAYHFFMGRERLLEKIWIPFTGALLVVFAVVQLVFAWMLRFSPIFDLGAIYDGAIQWVESGSFEKYYDYYYYFPNNLGGMAFLALIFASVRRVGIEDYFMAACVVNGIMSIMSMLLTALICKKKIGTGAAVFALFLFVISPPFWFIAPVFYTDSLSMVFPILIYFLYLKLRECKSDGKRLLLSLLMASAAAVGMLIKFTVAVMLISVCIDSILSCREKIHLIQAGTTVGVCGIIIALVFTGFNSLIYPDHLNREQAKVQNTPYLHWVMMGLKGDGAYNSEDYEFTRSFSGMEEQNDALLNEIVDRARDLGPDGLYKLFWKKTTKTFGSGTMNQSDFLDDNPAEPSRLHDYLLYSGDDYKTYRDICQTLHISLMALMAISGFSGLRRLMLGGEDSGRMAAELAVFGLMLFFACWETSGRYITNFFPIIFVCAVRGMDSLCAGVRFCLDRERQYNI